MGGSEPGRRTVALWGRRWRGFSLHLLWPPSRNAGIRRNPVLRRNLEDHHIFPRSTDSDKRSNSVLDNRYSFEGHASERANTRQAIMREPPTPCHSLAAQVDSRA